MKYETLSSYGIEVWRLCVPIKILNHDKRYKHDSKRSK